MVKWQMNVAHAAELSDEFGFQFTDKDVEVLLTVLHRESYSARSKHEAEVIHGLITACYHCQAVDELKAEAELEVPF